MWVRGVGDAGAVPQPCSLHKGSSLVEHPPLYPPLQAQPGPCTRAPSAVVALLKFRVSTVHLVHSALPWQPLWPSGPAATVWLAFGGVGQLGAVHKMPR